TGSLDILILTVVSLDINNFEIVLFELLPSSDNPISKGYSTSNISNIPVIVSGKVLRTLLLPGQMILISYANIKLFIWLSSNAITSFNTSKATDDVESEECLDMIYDPNNGVVISAEKTISNTCFLQILDTFNLEISVLK